MLSPARISSPSTPLRLTSLLKLLGSPAAVVS
jgi:hypothetical protein